MLDAASQFCHISWWLISSIAIVPSAVATDNDAFEVCVCHACAGGMALSSRGCRPSILYLCATPVIFSFSRTPCSDRLVQSTSTQLWRRSRSFDSSQAHRGLPRGMGCEPTTIARSVETRINLRQVAPFFCRPRCVSQCHVDRAASECLCCQAHPTGQAAFSQDPARTSSAKFNPPDVSSNHSHTEHVPRIDGFISQQAVKNTVQE
jgi:hypothetical protein